MQTNKRMDRKKGVILTINTSGEGVYKEKGSKFLAFAYKATTEEEIKERLAEIRKLYHDARHHCYAYVIGQNQEKYRANDDGEPKNSAGMPILRQINADNLSNVLIIVVRYFGGTKLGISGLVKAYKIAAKEAIENAGIVTETLKEDIKIKFQYICMNEVMKLIKKHNIEIKTQTNNLDCEMLLSIPLDNYNLLKESFSKIKGIKILEK